MYSDHSNARNVNAHHDNHKAIYITLFKAQIPVRPSSLTIEGGRRTGVSPLNIYIYIYHGITRERLRQGFFFADTSSKDVRSQIKTDAAV